MTRALAPLESRQRLQEREELFAPFYVEAEVLSDQNQTAFTEIVSFTVPSDHTGVLEDFGIFLSHPTAFQFTSFDLRVDGSRVENIVINLLELVQPRRGKLNVRLNENQKVALSYKRVGSITNMAFRVVVAGFLFGRVIPQAPVA